MSASTRTIQQSAGLGSIVQPLVLAGATLLAVLGIAWGALTMTAAKPAQATQAVIRPPAAIDHGSSQAAPLAGSAPVFVDHGGRFDTETTYRRLQAK